MKVFKAIVRRELASYFATPIALVFLVVFLVLSGIFTFQIGGFFERGQADLQPFFGWHPWLYLFIVPAVSMRLWAEERRSGTIELLLTLPITPLQAMAGKFVAAWIFLGLALALTFPMVLTVLYLGSPDLGVIIASYIGSLLMAGAFLSLGTFISTTTSNQVISFVISSVLCLSLILLGFDPVVQGLLAVFPSSVVELLSYVSFPYHFQSIQRGVVDIRSVIYFVSVIIFGLQAGVMVLDRVKAN